MSPAVSHVLLEAALRALVVALILWTGMRLLRIANAPLQKAAWTMVLAAAILMPLLVRWQLQPAWAAIHVSTANWPAHWLQIRHKANPADAPASQARPRAVEPAPQSTESSIDDMAAEPALPSGYEVENNADAQTPVIPEVRQAPIPAAQPRSFSLPLRSIVWLLYLGVCAALFLRLLYGLGCSIRLWTKARPVNLDGGISLPPGVEVRWSDKVASPVNIGSGILLPADYAEWGEQKLGVVLAHEAAHIEQHDFYLQFMARLYCTAMWFSPLGWWLKRKLSELGEAISDRAGLDAAGSPIAYAELLLEFAARPRPTYAGVAMAHSSNLHQRIERLLNESSFRRVFCGRRSTAVALVFPAVLVAASALVHVQAAAIPAQSAAAQTASSPASPAESQPSLTSQIHARPAPVVVEDPSAAEAATQESAPAPVPAPSATPAPRAAAVPSPTPAPAPQILVQVPTAPMVILPRLENLAPLPRTQLILRLNALPKMALINPIQLVAPSPEEAAQSEHRDTYRVFGDEGHRLRFDGDLSADCEEAAGKTRQSLQGQVLFVCHEGKPYVIDDPAALAQIDEIDKEMNDKSEQMKALGKQMRDQSQQAREEARKEREAAEKLPKPDITKEIAELDAAAAALKADQDGNISREQLQELQRKLSEVQRRLISSEIKIDVSSSVAFTKLSADQGKFGEQMGKLGSEMGQLAHERDEKIRAIIDESLKNGKAKPAN
jgi:beta-lactamase regulating signal transducer with metallopeptidase domain